MDGQLRIVNDSPDSLDDHSDSSPSPPHQSIRLCFCNQPFRESILVFLFFFPLYSTSEVDTLSPSLYLFLSFLYTLSLSIRLDGRLAPQ